MIACFFVSNVLMSFISCWHRDGEIDAKAEMTRMFKILCLQENDTVRPRIITHLGRDLTFAKTCGRVLYSNFAELCDRVS